MKLYKMTYANGSEEYYLAQNMTIAIKEANSITPNGMIETVNKCEWIRNFWVVE